MIGEYVAVASQSRPRLFCAGRPTRYSPTQIRHRDNVRQWPKVSPLPKKFLRTIDTMNGVTGWDEEALAALRGAANRGLGATGVALLQVRPLGPVLQYAGDVLAVAVEAGVPGADRLAEDCLNGLAGRGQTGDEELAAELRAALGARSTGLSRVPIRLGDLAGALDGRSGSGPQVLDLLHGDVLTTAELDGDPAFDARSEEYDAGRWLVLTPEPSGVPYSEEISRGRARAWLAAHGYRSAPRDL